MTTQQNALTVGAPATSRAANHGALTLRQVADGYMAAYTGRDSSRPHQVDWWVAHLGDLPIGEINDDHVFDALEELSSQDALCFVGRDASGNPKFRSRGKRRPGTINRYCATLGALYRFARRKRLLPPGWRNPLRMVERLPEHNERVRFLAEEERDRLLKICRVARWPRLYLLVLLAITTGARRGELVGLRWRDIDLERERAYVARTKNGQPKVLPLVPAAVAELKRLQGAADQLLFGSSRRPGRPMEFDAVFAEALSEARITDFRFHDLRHCCASYLAQSGASLLEIADVLGHRNTSVTKRYSHLTVDSKTQLVNRVLGGVK